LIRKEVNSMKNNSAPTNRLRELRDRSRLTLQEVSILTGFAVSAISRHESGSRSLSEEAIIKYANLYKVHTYELFREAGKEEDDEGDTEIRE
jgi:transcriptional regulator with XRE-family HTH domain